MTKQQIANFLKQLRKTSGLSANEVVESLKKYDIDISSKTLYGYESGLSMLNADAFISLCRIYKCDNPLDIFGAPSINPEEVHIIEIYRLLDDSGRSHVDTVLKWEADRMEQLKQSPAAIVELHNGSNEKGRLIDYYRSVSAGSGQVIFEDVYSERIMMPDIPEYRKAAYAVKVNGRSMEPRYNDGDILLIEPTCEVEVGEIGIFNVNGQAYVKKLGKDKLISLNKGYDDIRLTEDSLCMGRVVGKL